MRETRQIIQVKIWMIVLNRMTSSKIEYKEIAAVSDDKEKLVQWYNSQKVEPWNDGRWGKQFAKDSPLEWFNYQDLDQPSSFNHGLYSDWVEESEFERSPYFKS